MTLYTRPPIISPSSHHPSPLYKPNVQACNSITENRQAAKRPSKMLLAIRSDPDESRTTDPNPKPALSGHREFTARPIHA
ncbi:hypothetical protein LguiB_010412 [Lonicera macranthoides]